MVNVDRSNFIEQSNDFIKHVPNASWIAIDEEMTGIMLSPSMNPPRISKGDTPASRYPGVKQVPERYAIIQLGICLFEAKSGGEDADAELPNAVPTLAELIKSPHFLVRRYNFTLFPPVDASITREVVLNPSSIHFLQQHAMNLDAWTRNGIPFCSGPVAQKLCMELVEKREKREDSSKATSQHTNRRKVQLTRQEDKEFFARAMANLREWLDAAIVEPRVRQEEIPLQQPILQQEGGGNIASIAAGSAAPIPIPVPQQPPVGEGASFLLPPCNSFLRRALYEAIQEKYPALTLETVSATSQICVWRQSQQERASRNSRLWAEGWEKVMLESVGAWRVFLALSKACCGEDLNCPNNVTEHIMLAESADAGSPSMFDAIQSTSPSAAPRGKIPLVVHNGMHDLLFLMTHFHSPKLPDTWAECKELIHGYFPIIYDTKLMATEYCAPDDVQATYRRLPTYLSAVYERAVICQPRWQRLFCDVNEDGNGNQEHEASFDAYMTGAAFCGLSFIIYEQSQGISDNDELTEMPNFALWDQDALNDESISWMYGCNKLYFHLSPFTIDLSLPTECDPLGRDMSFESTFSVSGIDASISTRDIVMCLSNLYDTRGRRLTYEILWVDDTTFFVAATAKKQLREDSREEMEERFSEQGEVIWKALTNRFCNQELVQPLRSLPQTEKYVQHRVANPRAERERSFWNLWGLLGRGSDDRANDDTRSRKRQRVA